MRNSRRFLTALGAAQIYFNHFRPFPHIILFAGLFCLTSIFVPHPAEAAQDMVAGSVVSVRGKVEIAPAGEMARQASPGTALSPGDSIRTGGDGWAAILLADESLIQLNKNTDFEISKTAQKASWNYLKGIRPASAMAGSSTYRLDKGEAWIRNKDSGARIDIETPTVLGGIRGTEITVVVNPNGEVAINVLEGSVRAWNQHGEVTADENETVFTAPGASPVKRILMTPVNAVLWTIASPVIVSSRDFKLATGSLGARVKAGSSLISGFEDRDAGKVAEAERAFKSAMDTEREAASLGLGWAALDQNAWDDALKRFADAPDGWPETVLGRSLAYAGLSDLGKAHAVLREWKGASPSPDEFAAQEANLMMAEGGSAKALEITSALVARRPDMSPAWSVLSLAQLVRGENAKAAESAQRAISSSPGAPAGHMAQSYARQAGFDIDGALESSLMAMSVAPFHVPAMIQSARLLFGSDKTEEALKILDQAAHRAGPNADVSNLRGFMLLAMQKTDPSVESFKKAVSLDPGFGEPRMGMALALMRKGKVEDAMREISAANLLSPRRADFLSYWAKMLYQLKRFPQALDILDYAARLDPKDPTPHLYKAIILRDLRRPTDAIEEINKAISLNDNRAVYRSRFLLDQDMAVKNVDLSELYSQLGLGAWAKNRAMASVKSDYTNPSAHLFLAGALANMGRREKARGAELMLNTLLKPANINTYNSFNEYTSFFDAPSVQGKVDGFWGDYPNYDMVTSIYGADPQMGVSFLGGFDYLDTKGWSGDRNERTVTSLAQLKWDATPKTSAAFSFNRSDTEKIDPYSPKFDAYTPVARNDSASTTLQLGYAGFHHHFGPKSDALFLASVWDYALRTERFDILLEDPTGVGGSVTHSDSNVSYRQAQGQIMRGLGSHQLILGGAYYTSSQTGTDQNFLRVKMTDGIVLDSPAIATYPSLKETFATGYLQDIWAVAPSVTVEAAAYLEKLDTGYAADGLTWSVADVSPRVGVSWEPTINDTLRLAAFRYVQFGITDRIDPTDISGVHVFRDTMPGSKNEEYDAVWERGFDGGFFSITHYRMKSSTEFHSLFDGQEYQSVFTDTMSGIESDINIMPWRGAGLGAWLQYNNVASELSQDSDRNEYNAGLRLTHVWQIGFTATLSETYRKLMMKSGVISDQEIWLTDLSVNYELPGKTGMIGFSIDNIFDRRFNWIVDSFMFSGRDPKRNARLNVAFYF